METPPRRPAHRPWLGVRERLVVRVTPAEAARIQGAAADAGLTVQDQLAGMLRRLFAEEDRQLTA